MIPQVQLSFVDAFSPELVLKKADRQVISLPTGLKRQRNTVTFSATVHCRPIIHHEEYQRGDTWYNHSDYRSFREDRRITVRMMKRDVDSDDDTRVCARGLEHYLWDARETQNAAKAHAHNAVMDQQDICRRKGSHFSADLIARAYANETCIHRIEAYIKGIADEHCAVEFLQDESSVSIQDKVTSMWYSDRRSELPPRAPTRRVSTTPRAPLPFGYLSCNSKLQQITTTS